MNNHITNNNRLPVVLKDYPFLAALGMFLYLLFIEEYRFSFPFSLMVRTIRTVDLPLHLLGLTIAAVIISCALIVAFFWLAFISRPAYRFIYFAVFTTAILTQYNYHSVAGRFMTVTDFQSGISSPIEYWVDAAALFFEWRGNAPIFIFLVLLLLLWGWQKQGGKAALTLTAAIIILNSAVYYAGMSRTPALSVPAFWRTIMVAGLERTAANVVRREAVNYQAQSRPANNIVLIIDESVRGDHLSINSYGRDTTPYLRELANAGLVANWGIAAAAATCSINSNETIIMGLSTLPDTGINTLTNPTIFQYAQAMGYVTHYIDVQANILWNGMTAYDLTAVDHWVRRRDIGSGYDVDFRAADYIVDVTSQSVGHFIVVNKYGVHFQYNAIYPPEQAVWMPVPLLNQQGDPGEIVNSYDNAILYNVDTFFRRLLPNPTNLNETVFLYTSDHGQTLMQEGETWPHCGGTRNEAIVPMLLISQTPYDVDVAYWASHFNIFATLLDLMDVPDAARQHDYPLSLLQATRADSTNRFFLGGVVDGPVERSEETFLLHLRPVVADFDAPEE
jgi:glucan phosphoethanolaminetransferase (alkaline phosphatase superfamily)